MQPAHRHQKSSGRPFIRLVVAPAVLVLLLVFSACGVKAPPVAPDARPPIVASIGHLLEDGQLTLHWTVTAGSSLPQSLALYRSRSPLAEKPCDGCPLVFKPLRTIPADGLAQGTVTFILEPGYHYGFKMTATDANGLTGPDSQTIIFEY